jgi:chromate transporter
LQLALGFARLGALGFGGAGPQARQVLVNEQRWLDEGDFADVLGLGQALPGANVVNVSAILGDRWFGPLGAFVAVSSLTVPPLVVAIVLAGVFARLSRNALFTSIETAIAAAATGLILATALRMLATIRQARVFAAVLVLGTMALLIGLHVSLPLTVVIMVACGLLLERIPAFFGRASP